MDCYHFNKNFADSLDFLSPASQKNNPSNLQWSNCPEPSIASDNFTRTSDVLDARKLFYHNRGCLRPSSTSLLLKKTRDREIVKQQYCDEKIKGEPYYCTKSKQDTKHRQLIRVTVIPNSNTGAQTKLRKRRPCQRKIQSTVSNHESCFKAKNIFLVVAGNKREKIYQVKTTGSEYTNETRYYKDDDNPIKENFQTLLDSFNMDKKKKKKEKGKSKKEKTKDEDETRSNVSLSSYMNDYGDPITSFFKDCVCPPNETVTSRKSRVRITGKIGLTENDKYVMQCAATVDGMPIESNFFQGQHESPPEYKMHGTKETERVNYPVDESFKAYQRDENIQTNIQNDSYFRPTPCPAFMNTCPGSRSVETQCCPRNMNTVCFSNIEKLKIYASKDENVQCNCPQDLLFNSKDVETEADNYPKSYNYSNGCSSPLVIISVYPKQDVLDKNANDASSTKDLDILPTREKVAEGKNDKTGKKKQGKKSRPGSPTPDKGRLKKKDEKKLEKPKGNDKKVKDKLPLKGNKKGQKKEETEQKMVQTASKGTASQKRQSRSPERRQSGEHIITFKKCAECCSGCAANRNGEGNRRGLLSNKKQVLNWVSAKNDASNVAINIDGENDFCDVFLRQNDVTTDVEMRKTIKDDTITDQSDNGSLENFLLLSKQARFESKSFSETVLFNQPNTDNNATLENTKPELKVRDSIEIFHRREEKHSNSMNSSSTGLSSTNSCYQAKLANNKHFQGDTCDLTNPVERDKQIRQLLGIQKTTFNPSKTDEEHKRSRNYHEKFAAQAEGRCSLHSIYHQKRPTDINTYRNVKEARGFHKNEAITQVSSDHSSLDCLLEEITNCNQNSGAFMNLCKDGGLLNASKKSPCACKDCEICRHKKPLQGFKKDPVIVNSQMHLIDNSNDIIFFKTGSRRDSRKICVSKQCNKKPCGVVVQCPHKSQVCDKRPCGVVVQCPHKSQECNKTPCSVLLNCSDECQECPRLSNCSSKESTFCQELKNPKCCQRPPGKGVCDCKSPLYQQLVMNRNINIYLQIEKFTKQRPIILSRKQYNKVKKTIEKARGKNRSTGVGNICKPCDGSVRETEKSHEKKRLPSADCWCHMNTVTQTRKNNNTIFFVQSCNKEEKERFCKFKAVEGQGEQCRYRQEKQIEFMEQSINKTHNQIKNCEEQIVKTCKDSNKNKRLLQSKYEGNVSKHSACCQIMGDDDICPTNCSKCLKPKLSSCEDCIRKKKICEHICLCYKTRATENEKFEPSIQDHYLNDKLITKGKKYSASSTELRYTNVVYANYRLKHNITFSSSNVRKVNVQPTVKNRLTKLTDSLHTIFRGQRRMPTPNLGTSVYSLCSEYSDADCSSKHGVVEKQPEERKPFLRRLMSILVMRSGVKVNVKQPRKPPTMKSSIDSYHINTSLGAIELSSSLYDTSASFYSNHSIRPINSRMKRGFLNSVREFLTNKRP